MKEWRKGARASLQRVPATPQHVTNMAIRAGEWWKDSTKTCARHALFSLNIPSFSPVGNACWSGVRGDKREESLRHAIPPLPHPIPPSIPPYQFHILLTLFSKFFSTFVHTTCSLSVSSSYLALDEIYHPFQAVVQNNPTRKPIEYKCSLVYHKLRDYHPLWFWFPPELLTALIPA